MNRDTGPIVSSAHLVSEKSAELSEFEFGLMIASEAFNRWVVRCMGAAGVRAYIGDGNFGGVYQKPDEQMMRMWRIGVEETREALEGPWT